MLRVAVFLFLIQEYNCHLVLLQNVSREVSISNRVPVNSGTPPEAFDWRDKNMVSPVKNQLHCGACWAFSIIAGIESHLKIYRRVEEVLSEQFLIDCEDASKGCSNARLLDVFADIITKFGGVLRDDDYYPYADGQLECRWHRPIVSGPDYGTALALSVGRDTPHPKPQPIPVVGFRRVFADEDIMAEFVYKFGPLSAGINSASMARYKGGIDEPSPEYCNPKNLDHAVLIVGYNVYESRSGVRVPYWIIKNSWGTDFGDHGFYYLVRGRNACGITSDVSFPFVD